MPSSVDSVVTVEVPADEARNRGGLEAVEVVKDALAEMFVDRRALVPGEPLDAAKHLIADPGFVLDAELPAICSG